MANTNYGINHPLAVKLWSKKLFHEALKTTWVYKFLGTNTNSVVQVVEDLRKSAGDRVRNGLRMLLTGDGIQGDGTLEGNEESLVTFFDDSFIDRRAHRQGGRRSQDADAHDPAGQDRRRRLLHPLHAPVRPLPAAASGRHGGELG